MTPAASASTRYDRNLDWGLSKSGFIRDRSDMAPRFAQMAGWPDGRMDRDGNGKIQWKEYRRAGAARFKTIDRNGDRKISPTEFSGRD